jgi:uncharacterized membrane protein YeaQ/YmgE (transglycosylase-associated protein family)
VSEDYSSGVGLIGYLIGLVLTGLVVGALGRLALPGPDPLGIGQTILVGIGGAFIGGVITTLIAGRSAWSFLVAVACATGIVYLIRRSRGGTLTDPGNISGRGPR